MSCLEHSMCLVNINSLPSPSRSPSLPHHCGATCAGRKREKACSVGFYWQMSKNNNFLPFPQAPSYPQCDCKARFKRAHSHWHTPQSDNPHHQCHQVSLAPAALHRGEPGAPGNPEIYPGPEALAAFQFISFFCGGASGP